MDKSEYMKKLIELRDDVDKKRDELLGLWQGINYLILELDYDIKEDGRQNLS